MIIDENEYADPKNKCENPLCKLNKDGKCSTNPKILEISNESTGFKNRVCDTYEKTLEEIDPKNLCRIKQCPFNNSKGICRHMNPVINGITCSTYFEWTELQRELKEIEKRLKEDNKKAKKELLKTNIAIWIFNIIVMGVIGFLGMMIVWDVKFILEELFKAPMTFRIVLEGILVSIILGIKIQAIFYIMYLQIEAYRKAKEEIDK